MTTRSRDWPRAAQRDRWIVSYADLMTLLFAVFVVLFTAAQKRIVAGAPARGTTAPRTTGDRQDASSERRQALYEQLNNVLGPVLKTENVSLRQLPDGVVVRLNEAGFFARADATPLPSVDELLHSVAAIAVAAGASIRVEGYTDDQPIHTAHFRSNWELSTARAQAVLELLLREPGIDPGRLSVAGYGAYHPVASNGAEAGRRQNRRVDLVVIPDSAVTPMPQ